MSDAALSDHARRNRAWWDEQAEAYQREHGAFSTPFEALCWDEGEERLDGALHRDYFGLHQIELADSPVEFELPYGEWIRLFRANGLAVEELREIRPPDGAISTYRNDDETAWARRWPMEQIWRVRKE